MVVVVVVVNFMIREILEGGVPAASARVGRFSGAGDKKLKEEVLIKYIG